MSTLRSSLDAELRDFPLRYDSDHAAPSQSLSHGMLGMTVFHIVRAHQSPELRDNASGWFRRVFDCQISAGSSCGLYQGLPAVYFVTLLAKHADVDGADEVLARLRSPLNDVLVRKSGSVRAKLSCDKLSSFSDFDVFSGLAGLTALACLSDVTPSAGLSQALSALVLVCGQQKTGLPGWWVGHMPDLSVSKNSSHGNLGMAHGAAGILAALSRSATMGFAVPGQLEAVATLSELFIDFMQESDSCCWWPEVVTESEYISRTTTQKAPGRPSWCYGNPGISRALQLAGQALGSSDIQHVAERALLTSLSSEEQLRLVSDNSLCHGWSGLLITLHRVAQDACCHETRSKLQGAVDSLLARNTSIQLPSSHGLLVGSAGGAILSHFLSEGQEPGIPWDSCLLVS